MLPVLAICMFLIQFQAHKLWQVHRKKNSNLNAFIHEDFSGIRIVQSFAAEEEKQRDFDQCSDGAQTKLCQCSSVIRPVQCTC